MTDETTLTVRTINAREQAEEDVIRCARGDQLWGSVDDDSRSLHDLLDHVDPADHICDEFGAVTDRYPPILEQKMAHFLSQRLKRGEWGIWEHPSATFEITGLSRAAHSQLIRHRHLTFDVMSNRKIDMGKLALGQVFIYPPSFAAETVATRDGERKIEADPERRLRMAETLYAACLDTYDQFVAWGVPEEDARYLLPQGQATNLRVSGNARALMHLLNVRLNLNVQWEARNGMEQLLDECKSWLPITFRLFDDHRPIPLAP